MISGGHEGKVVDGRRGKMKDVSRRQLTQSFTGKNLDFTLSWKLDSLIWRMDYRER